MVDTLGGWPYKITKSGNLVTLEFYPKTPVKNKDNPPGKFKLTLDSNDKKKLQKILS